MGEGTIAEDTMTEQPVSSPEAVARSPRTARRRRPGPSAVIAASAATFAMLFGFLTYQLRSGHDPAIGGSASTTSTAPSKVLVRRVIRHRVVTTVVPAASSSAGASMTSTSGSSPVVSSSAPTTAAPAPAPVTTSAS
jgi:hypothetical protein